MDPDISDVQPPTNDPSQSSSESSDPLPPTTFQDIAEHLECADYVSPSRFESWYTQLMQAPSGSHLDPMLRIVVSILGYLIDSPRRASAFGVITEILADGSRYGM